MRANSHIKAQAKTLLNLCLEADGTVCGRRALEVVRALEANPPKRGLLVLLREFCGRLERQISKTQALIEHAGAIDAGEIKTLLSALEQKAGRSLRPVLKEAPSLIAGVRARVGDDVYDASVAARLEALRRALN